MSSTVYTQGGARVELEEMSGSGGEGQIYQIKGSELECAKIYLSQKNSPEIRDKIEAMIKNAPEDPNWQTQGFRSIAWPSRTLFFDRNADRFAGFAMPFIDTSKYKQSHKVFSQSDRSRLFAGFNWEYLLTAAYNMTSAIAALHKAGHCVGDLQDQNILVSGQALVALVDCDSFQIKDRESNRIFYTRVGIGEYRAPEVMDRDFVKEDIDRYSTDLFALAVLVFKFLMNGFHPFSAKGRAVEDLPTKEEKIVKGIFPYSDKIKKKTVEPPPMAPPYKIVPPALRELFEKCFIDGHSDPKQRPSAEAWFHALKEAKGQVIKCPKNPHHVFANHLKSCPWCEMYKNSGRDPFGEPGHQIALKPAVAPQAVPPLMIQPAVAQAAPAIKTNRLRLSLSDELIYKLKLSGAMFLAGAVFGLLMSFLHFPRAAATLGELTLSGGRIAVILAMLCAWPLSLYAGLWKFKHSIFTALLALAGFALATWALDYLVFKHAYHLLAGVSWGLILFSLGKLSADGFFKAKTGLKRKAVMMAAGSLLIVGAVYSAASRFAGKWHEPIEVSVTSRDADVRSSPREDHNVVNTVYKGAPLYLLKTEDGWSLIIYKQKVREPHSLTSALNLLVCGVSGFKYSICGDGWILDRQVSAPH